MRPQRKRMIVETTRAFVKLKQNKAAVSAGGTKFDLEVTFDPGVILDPGVIFDLEVMFDLKNAKWHSVNYKT